MVTGVVANDIASLYFVVDQNNINVFRPDYFFQVVFFTQIAFNGLLPMTVCQQEKNWNRNQKQDVECSISRLHIKYGGGFKIKIVKYLTLN